MIYAVIGMLAICAGILQGTTGFGAGIVMMMVLPGFFVLNQATGVSCAIISILNLFMFLRYRNYVKIQKVIWPAVLYVAVSSISIVFSARVNQAMMKKVFGMFLILLSVYYLFFNKSRTEPLNPLASVAFIVASGVCDGLFGIGGPLMVVFFLGQTHSKEEYLGTTQALFLTNQIYGTGIRLFNRILTIYHLPFIGIGMLCIILGLKIANRIVDRLDGEKMKKVTYVVIGISGIMNMI